MTKTNRKQTNKLPMTSSLTISQREVQELGKEESHQDVSEEEESSLLEHEDLSWKVARLVKCQTRINNNNGEKQQLEKENEVAQVTNDGELMERTDLFDKQFLQNVADIVGKVWNMGSRIFKTKKEALKERTRVWKSSEHWEETKKGHEDKSDEKVTLKVRTVWHPGEHLRTREPKHEHVDKSNKEETKEERTKVGKPDIGWDEDANEFLKQHSRRAPATAAPAAAVRAAPVAAASALPQPSVGPSGDRVAYVRRVATITVAEGGRKERQKETEKKKPTRPETGVSSRTSITAANEGREENQGKTETAKSNVSEAKTTETRKTETAASTMTTIKTTEGGKKGRQKQEELKEVHRISEALKQSKEEFEAELEVKVKAIEEVNLTRAKRAELDNVIKDLKYEVEETEKQSDAVDAACDKLEQEKKVLVQKLLEQKQYSNKMYELNLRLQEGQELSLVMAESQAGLSDQEIKELDAGNQNLLGKVLDMDGNLSKRLDKQEHMDNTLMNRIKKLHSNNSDSVSSIRLRLSDLDKDGKDNITQIVNPQKTINNQNERVNTVNANRQKATEKDKFRPAEDRLANINSHIQGLNKTMVVSEQKHTETAEKIQEVTVLTSNIQVQVKAQEQKMVEQSANDMNQIKEQLKDIENQAGVSGQKIKELDAGHQTLVEKISGMENGVADRLDDLAKADASLLAKLSALESTNDQTVRAATADLEKKIHDAEHRLDQSSKTEIQSFTQHLEEQMRTNNSNTERRLAEADAGSQQLLEKLLEVEKDVEGKVRDNASSVQNQLTNLDADNKNNAQMLVTLRESINIQVQETKKVDAERQRSDAKAEEVHNFQILFEQDSHPQTRNLLQSLWNEYLSEEQRDISHEMRSQAVVPGESREKKTGDMSSLHETFQFENKFGEPQEKLPRQSLEKAFQGAQMEGEMMLARSGGLPFPKTIGSKCSDQQGGSSNTLLQHLWKNFMARGKHESSHGVAAQVVMHGQPKDKEEESFQVPYVQEGFKFRGNDGQSHGERKELQRPTNDIGGNIPFPHHAVDAAETTDSGRVEKSQEEAPLPERQSLRGGLASMERIQAKPFQRNQRRFKGRKYHCGPTQKRHKRSASCESCGKRFLRLSNLRRHFWLHGGTHPPKCSKCRILYRFSSSITSLRRLFLEEQRPKEERIGRVRKPCKDCEKVSTGRTFLRCHQENTHGAGLKTCKECCQKYKRELCQARQQTIHVGLRCSPSGQDLGDDPYLVQLGKADPRRDRFEYQECGANFKRMRHFREHVQGHEQMLACHRCSKSSQLQGGLHKHLPSHGGHVESHCKECKNMLHATSYLKRHMDIQLWARLLLKVSAMHKSSRIEATVENHTRMQQDIPMAEQPW